MDVLSPFISIHSVDFVKHFTGVRAIEDHTTKFLWGLDSHGIDAYDGITADVEDKHGEPFGVSQKTPRISAQGA